MLRDVWVCVQNGFNIITAAITLDLNIIIIIIAARWSVIMLRDVSMCTKEISTSKWCRQLQPSFVCRIDRLRPPTFMMSMRWYIFLADNKCLFGYWQPKTATFLGLMVIYFQAIANTNLFRRSMNSPRPLSSLTPPSLLHLASVSGVPLSLPSHYLIAGSFNWLFDSWDF